MFDGNKYGCDMETHLFLTLQLPLLLVSLIFFFFLSLPVACGILVPQPGIEPRPSAVKMWSINHWTAREFPAPFLLN